MMRKTGLHLNVREVAGVYVICNTEDRKCYVGQSANIRTRIRGHMTDIRKGEHANKELQADMLRLGEGAFEVQIVYCSEDLVERLSKEAEYIAQLKSDLPEFGYNRSWYSSGRQVLSAAAAGCHAGNKNGMYGRVQSNEAREKIGQANKGRLAGDLAPKAKLTWEQVAEIRDSAMTRRELSVKYGVTPCTVHDILSGRTWRAKC